MNTKNSIGLPLIFLIVGLGLIACETKSTTNNTTQTAVGKDSIVSLIAAGRDQKKSNTVRKDNLIRAYDRAQLVRSDTTRLKHLSRIQWSFLGLKDSLWFRKTNKETNELAQTVGDTLRTGGSFWDLGIFFYEKGIKDSAYLNLSLAQKTFRSLGDNKRAGTLLYDMANIQEQVKDYTGSEINVIRAIELLKPLDEDFMLYRCYNLLGIVTKELKDYDRSSEYYTNAAEYLEKSGSNDSYTPELKNNLGVTYLEKGDRVKAANCFKEVLDRDSLRIKNPELYAKALNNLAKSQYDLKTGIDVGTMFQKSLIIRDSIEDLSGLAGGYFSLAKYQLYNKDTINAILNAQQSKAYAEKSNNNERLLESLELLTRIDKKNASIHGQNYIALNDSLQNEERKIRNKFARIRFETNEVAAENRLLTRQNQLWAGLALSILLLGTSAYVILMQRSKNQKLRFERQQQRKNEEIFNLMLSEKQQFEEGKKMEQKRISEELHDGVLGKMLGARMVLTGLNKKDGPDAIQERAGAILALKDVEGEVRTISHELSHAAYQEFHNFIRSIRDLLQNVCDAANINHKFEYADEVRWDELNGDIKINLYRMVQESLQNAVKHAQCKNIELNFNKEQDHLHVLIKDDGVGFEFSKKKRGIGIRNIRSRIKKIDGTWHIDSKPGAGTSTKLTIPIKYFSQEEEPQTFEQVEKV